MSQPIQIDALRMQLLDAYVARETADERIKSLRNRIAGVTLGQPQGWRGRAWLTVCNV